MIDDIGFKNACDLILSGNQSAFIEGSKKFLNVLRKELGYNYGKGYAITKTNDEVTFVSKFNSNNIIVTVAKQDGSYVILYGRNGKHILKKSISKSNPDYSGLVTDLIAIQSNLY